MSNLTKRPIPQKGEKPKGGKSKTRPLRANAKGQSCTLRLSQCRHDPEYTVLCHIRRFGWAGAAQKPIDLLAYFGCDKCHEMQEQHDPECTYEDILRAMGETLMVQAQSGKLRY